MLTFSQAPQIIIGPCWLSCWRGKASCNSGSSCYAFRSCFLTISVMHDTCLGYEVLTSLSDMSGPSPPPPLNTFPRAPQYPLKTLAYLKQIHIQKGSSITY